MNGRIVTVLVTLACSLAACGDGEVPAASADPCGTVTNDAGGGVPRDDRQGDGDTTLVFASEGRLWVHDVRDRTTAAVTGDGTGLKRSRPSIRDTATISFVVEWSEPDDADVLGKHAVRLGPPGSATSGQSGELLRAEGAISALDWERSGGRLAYLVDDAKASKRVLCVLDASGAGVSRVFEYQTITGRHTFQHDEVAVTWSRDGTRVLVTDTFAAGDTGGTVFVLDAQGKAVTDAVNGTFARWFPDGRVLFRDYDGDALRWHALDVASGTKTELALDGNRFRPWLDPEGTSVAFDDGAATPSIHIAEIATGKSRMLVRGYAGPVWLSRAPSIAATKTEPCSKDLCDFAPWTATTSGARIDLAGDVQTIEPMVTVPDAFEPNVDVF